MSHRIDLYTRAGCHLCEMAEPRVRSAAEEFGAELQIHDVDADPALRERYGDDVPAVVVDGSLHAFHRVDDERLRAVLAQPGPERPSGAP